MPRPVFLVALLLTAAAACYIGPGSGPSAPTRCGQRLQGSDDVPRLQGLEDIVVRLLGRFGVTCAALEGWETQPLPVDNGESWGTPGHHVAGLCHCDWRLMQVAAPGWLAYPHEVLHAVECPATDDAHATWVDGGQYGALGEVGREVADAGL